MLSKVKIVSGQRKVYNKRGVSIVIDRIIQLMLLLSLLMLIFVIAFLLLAIGVVVPGFLDELFLLGLLIFFVQWVWNHRDASGNENFFVREMRKIYLAALTKEIRGKLVDYRADRGFFVLQSGTRAYRFPILSLAEYDRTRLLHWLEENDDVLMIVYIHVLTRNMSHYEFPLQN